MHPLPSPDTPSHALPWPPCRPLTHPPGTTLLCPSRAHATSSNWLPHPHLPRAPCDTTIPLGQLPITHLTYLNPHPIGTTRYHPNACSNVASFLPTHIVGQDLAIQQLVDAVCEHLLPDTQRGRPPGGGAPGSALAGRKPLIISVHGPPGVGKTYTHTLLARALYNRDPAAAGECPGEHCRGAKVRGKGWGRGHGGGCRRVWRRGVGGGGRGGGARGGGGGAGGGGEGGGAKGKAAGSKAWRMRVGKVLVC